MRTSGNLNITVIFLSHRSRYVASNQQHLLQTKNLITTDLSLGGDV